MSDISPQFLTQERNEAAASPQIAPAVQPAVLTYWGWRDTGKPKERSLHAKVTGGIAGYKRKHNGVAPTLVLLHPSQFAECGDVDGLLVQPSTWVQFNEFYYA